LSATHSSICGGRLATSISRRFAGSCRTWWNSPVRPGRNSRRPWTSNWTRKRRRSCRNCSAICHSEAGVARKDAKMNAQRAQRKNAMTHNEIARIVVDAAFRIHSRLGPGLYESVYETLLAYELEKRGLAVACQVPIPLVYETVCIKEAFKADIIVEDKVILEIKSVEGLESVHFKQLITYLSLADKRLGLLMNFN